MATNRKGVRVRATAARVVDAVVSSGRSLDVALASHEADVADQDKALLRMLCYGTLRHHWRLQSWLDQLLQRSLRQRDSVVRSLLAVGLYQLTDTRIPDHAAVSETVEAARMLRQSKYAGLVNACMRRFQRDKVDATDAATDEVRFNHPQWIIDTIARDWPDDWQHILEANNERAAMWLRVNTAHGTVRAYLERLSAAGIEASTSHRHAAAVCLAQPVATEGLPGFADGDVSVQDGAAQIAAPWLLDSVRGRVLDACAAPGGKSAHLLEIGGDDVELTCLDVDEQRLDAVSENLHRLGLVATVCAGDASKPGEWWDKRPYDAILLDAPCSASGVIRRHPDIKLLRRADDIDRLAALQASILGALWSLLTPGGRLLYVTCSVFAAENEHVVGAFLDGHSDAQEKDLLPNNNISDVMRHKACGYQVLPGSAAMDGFYFACLEKVS